MPMFRMSHRTARRRAKKYLANINLDAYDMPARGGGEYGAFSWLTAYVEGRTRLHPVEYAFLIMTRDGLYAETLLRAVGLTAWTLARC